LYKFFLRQRERENFKILQVLICKLFAKALKKVMACGALAMCLQNLLAYYFSAS
jgi:hypothetical protein